MTHNLRFVYVLVALLTVTGVSADVIDSVNASFRPCGFYGAGEVGWLYTPSFSYTLTGINTRFSGDRIINIEVYDDAPPNGGTLIGSTSFVPGTEPREDPFVGADFPTPISFVAGQDYFIGFNNTAQMGANVTCHDQAIRLDNYSAMTTNSTYDGSFTPATTESPHQSIICRPILQFEGLPTYAAIVNVSNEQGDGGSAAGLLLWDEELQRNVARVYETNSGALISETTIGTSGHSMKSFISTSDMSGDGVSELSATGVHSTGKVEVFLRDSITGAPISDTPYPKRNYPKGSVFASGFTESSGQGLGILGVDSDNRTSVIFKDALGGELLADIRFGHNIDALAVESLSDMTGNGVDEVAVLGNTLSGRIRVSIRDSLTKEVVSNLWFSRQFPALDFGIVPDMSDNGFEEIAVLGASESGEVQVTIKDAMTGDLLGGYRFATAFKPIALVVVEDEVPLVGVLGRREDGATRVNLKIAATGRLVRGVRFHNAILPRDIAVLKDTNGNEASELAVLGFDETGQAYLQVKDSRTGAVLIVRKVP